MAKGVILSTRMSRTLAAALRRWARESKTTRSRFLAGLVQAEMERRASALEMQDIYQRERQGE